MSADPAAILAAGCQRGERWLQLGVYGLFAAGAVLLAGSMAGKSREAVGALLLVMLALPTFFLWLGWFSRLLLLRAEAQAMLTPAMPGMIDRTLLALAVLTIFAPAFLISRGTGVEFAWAAGCLGCIAASGLLLALLQRGLAGLLGLLPMLVAGIDGNMVATLIDWKDATPALAALLLLLAAWRWLRVSADIQRWQQPDWRQPLVFAMGRRGSVFAGSDLLDPHVQEGMLPRWFRHGADLRNYRPGEVRTMRALLGGVFAPRGWKQALASIVAWLLVLALMLHYFTRDGDSPAQMVLFVALVAGGILLALPFALRLQALYQGHGGEMAELALLPGWGDAPRARHTLLRAVVGVYGRMALLLLAVMLGAAVLTGQVGVVVLACVSALAVIAVGVCGWLRPLAGRPWRLHAGYALLLVLLGVPALGCTIAAFGGGALLVPMTVAWSLVLLGACWVARSLWVAFEARPQPFLMR